MNILYNCKVLFRPELIIPDRDIIKNIKFKEGFNNDGEYIRRNNPYVCNHDCRYVGSLFAGATTR